MARTGGAPRTPPTSATVPPPLSRSGHQDGKGSWRKTAGVFSFLTTCKSTPPVRCHREVYGASSQEWLRCTTISQGTCLQQLKASAAELTVTGWGPCWGQLLGCNTTPPGHPHTHTPTRRTLCGCHSVPRTPWAAGNSGLCARSTQKPLVCRSQPTCHPHPKGLLNPGMQKQG